MSIAESIKEKRLLTSKAKELIQILEEKQTIEFVRWGKSPYFFFLEDVIWETKELQEKWEKQLETS